MSDESLASVPPKFQSHEARVSVSVRTLATPLLEPLRSTATRSRSTSVGLAPYMADVSAVLVARTYLLVKSLRNGTSDILSLLYGLMG